MKSVESYYDYPLTTTRTIAWDSPSAWGPGFSIESTFQPLTTSNLSAHVKAQSSCYDSKIDLLAQYLASNSTDASQLSATATDKSRYKKRHRRRTATSTTAETTKSVVIDVHPLPFPYHNDNIFLPTVETGRTRFDSESTQSLYDQQSTNRNSAHHQQRHSNGLISRINGNHHRHRRDSRASHYSTFTTNTDTTTSTSTYNTNSSTLQHDTQQNSTLYRIQTTKRQLNNLISRNRTSTDSTQRSLSSLLTRKRMRTSSRSNAGTGITSSQPNDSTETENSWNDPHFERRKRPSSVLISPAAYYAYCQGKPIATLPPSPSASPQDCQENHYTCSTAVEKTSCSATEALTTPDVFGTISQIDYKTARQNQSIYASSSFNQCHNGNAACYLRSQQRSTFLSRFTRKFWPFNQH